MRELPLDDYVEAAAGQLEREGHAEAAADREPLCAGPARSPRRRRRPLVEVWPLIRFLFEPPVEDEKAWGKVMDAEAAGNLAAAAKVLREVEPFDEADARGALTELLELSGRSRESSSSRCASRSPARRSLRASSSRSLRSVVKARLNASIWL